MTTAIAAYEFKDGKLRPYIANHTHDDRYYTETETDNILTARPYLYSQSAEPTNKVAGKTLWHDTDDDTLKIWNGTDWVTISASSSSAKWG